MTIKEFAEKYNVPYNIVYQATYEVKPTGNEEKAKTYDEQQLREAVSNIVYGMWNRSRQSACKYAIYMSRLNTWNA